MKKPTINIYSITSSNQNSCIYIGVTSRSLKIRLSEHIRNNTGTCFKQWLEQEISQGHEIFINTLDVVYKKESKFWEGFWICNFKSWGFTTLNSNIGGGGPLYMTTQQKEKMSLCKKGVKNPFYNKKHTKISKEKISCNNSRYWKGRKLRPEMVRKLSESNSIPVDQFDKLGNFIKHWSSITEASNILGIDSSSIVKVLKNKRKKAGNYGWKYKK